jgi:drug/metabolite transporter superfamily protein YnfA
VYRRRHTAVNVLRLAILIALDVAIAFAIARYAQRRFAADFGGVFVLTGVAFLALAVLLLAPLVWTSR